jgi:CDP-glucose 4,6-dehydratase
VKLVEKDAPMNVLVTGSEGLIGKALCRLLDERGDQAHHYDLTSKLGGNVLDRSDILAITARGFDAIIHLAAQSGVEKARSNARDAWELNVMGTLNVLEAAREHHTPVVIASSNHVYGDHKGRPTPEKTPLTALDTYSATKIAADVMARSYWHNYGLPVAVIRNTNCFGPNSPHVDHLIEGTIMSCLNDEDLQMRTNGETKKAYLYVDDAAQAYITIMDALVAENAEGPIPSGLIAGQAFNVTGENHKALEVAQEVISQMGGNIRINLGPKATDNYDENLDDAKIREMGWEPQVSLKEGIRRTMDAFTVRYTVPV